MPELEFSIYCGICGAGLCGDTSVTGTIVTVECESCARKIDLLETEISDLEEEIDDLNGTIERLEEEIDELKDNK